LRKSLGISGNALTIEEIPVMPMQLGKTKAFPEMPRQLRKFVIFSYLFKNPSILGKPETTLSKSLLKFKNLN